MATWYYSSEATGANDGTSEADAWTDFTTAVTGLSAGDILYLKTPSDGSRVNLGNFIDITVTGTIDDVTVIEGYKDTPGDGQPFMCYTSFLEITDGSSVLMKYLDISNGGGGYNYQTIQNLYGAILYRCKVRSVNTSFAAQLNLDSMAIESTFIANYNGGVLGIYREGGLYNCCVIQESSDGDGISWNVQYVGNSILTNNIITCTNPSNTGRGIHVAGFQQAADTKFVSNNTIYGFGTGIEVDSATTEKRENVIFYGNLISNCGSGINNPQTSSSTTDSFFSLANAFGNISGTNHTNISENGIVDSIQLTASPFEDTTDFVINDTAGGGALLKGLLGLPDVKGLTATNRVSYPTYGAVVPSPFFEYLDSGSFDGSTGGVGDTLTVSGRSYQLIQDNPRVWRRV